MTTLGPSTDYTGAAVTQGGKKTFIATMRTFIADLLGTDSADKPAVRALLEVAPRAARIDVASVAGTVDLTADAPNTDDIQITGALAITAFTVAEGRVLRVRAGGAFTLANNSAIVTQTGGTLTLAAGDTFMLRATAADTVEVIGLARVTTVVADASITAPKLSGAQSGSAPIFAARAWGYFNGTTAGTNAPIAGGNVTSITRNGTGDYTVTFATAMGSANYAPNVNMSTPAASAFASASANFRTGAGVLSPPATGSFRFTTVSAGVAFDPDYVFFAVFAQ